MFGTRSSSPISTVSITCKQYEEAGTSGSFEAGTETGRLISDMAAFLSVGGGALKGGALLAEKVTAKVAAKAELAGAKATPSGLVSGETGFADTGKAAANDADFGGAKATGAAEVPATSAIARVGLRDDLAAQAGIPRNIAELPSSMWGKSIDDIKQSLMLDGASLTPKPPLAGTSGKEQVFNVEGHPTIKEVEFHPGGGTHGDSPYYKLVTTEKIGAKNIEIRVIDPSPDFRPGTITRYQQYYDAQGNPLKYEGGEWKGWK